MTDGTQMERERISVPGADAVVDALAAAPRPDGVTAARVLGAAEVAWKPIRDQIRASERAIILAQRDDGPVLAARFFPPGDPTTVHDHGCAGACIVVEGRDRYERFERLDAGRARLESVHDLVLGDVAWWNAPPDDLHRQVGLDDGAIELVLMTAAPFEAAELAEVSTESSPLRDAVVQGWLTGDIATLEPWYHPDALLDLNVPHWRMQHRGGRQLLQLLDEEEFSKPDRRLAYLRVTDTAGGLLLETEMRFTEGGQRRAFREVHNLRCRNGVVVEEVVWCSGISDAATIEAQWANAPMERM